MSCSITYILRTYIGTLLLQLWSVHSVMPQFYPSIPPSLRDWALQQSLFFVASAPLTGHHINLSPKGLPNTSFAILGPNEAAYVDATGSGSETISHLRENGRITVLFCSFDAAPRILRLFCRGDVIEWQDLTFGEYLHRMKGSNDEHVPAARAIIRLDVFKVYTPYSLIIPPYFVLDILVSIYI